MTLPAFAVAHGRPRRTSTANATLASNGVANACDRLRARASGERSSRAAALAGEHDTFVRVLETHELSRLESRGDAEPAERGGSPALIPCRERRERVRLASS